jgi:hypothetical protein
MKWWRKQQYRKFCGKINTLWVLPERKKPLGKQSSPSTRHGGAWGRGDIAPTHSRPRHKMGVSGQHHAPAALYPRGKDPPTRKTERTIILKWIWGIQGWR